MAAKCSPSSPGSPPLSPSREQLSGPEEGVSFSGKFHLPPGFRFHPTDQELVLYYLRRKVCGLKIEFDVIAEINLYEFEPWDLPEISCLQTRDLEWYFFSPIDKKYPNGGRTNRSTHAGYWKATGKDRPITSGSRIVGMKKTLVFYKGRAPKGERTDWVMREYRLTDPECERIRAQQNTFVVCRVFKKSGPGPRNGEQYGAPVEDAEWECLETEGDGHDRMGARPSSNTNSGDKDFKCGESLGENGSTCMNDLPSLEANCSERVCVDSNAQLQYIKGETMKIAKYEVKDLVGADYLDLASSSIGQLATRTLQVPSCSESSLENESDLLESNLVFVTHDEEGLWDSMLELAGQDQCFDRLSNLMRCFNLCPCYQVLEFESHMDAIGLAASHLFEFGNQVREQEKLLKVLHVLFSSRIYPNIKVQDSVSLCLIKRATTCSSDAIRCPEVCLFSKQPEVLEDTVLKALQQVRFIEAIQSAHPSTTDSSSQYPVIYHCIPNADRFFQGISNCTFLAGGYYLEKTSHSKHTRSFKSATIGSDGAKEFLLVLNLIWHLTNVLGALAIVLSTISEQPELRNKDLESVEILGTDVGDVHPLPADTSAESFGKEAFTHVTCDHVFSSCMRFSVMEEEMLLHPLLHVDRKLKLVVNSFDEVAELHVALVFLLLLVAGQHLKLLQCLHRPVFHYSWRQGMTMTSTCT